MKADRRPARRGGYVTLERHGKEFYSRIAGGKETLKRHGRDHFVRMSQKAAQLRRERAEARRKEAEHTEE